MLIYSDYKAYKKVSYARVIDQKDVFSGYMTCLTSVVCVPNIYNFSILSTKVVELKGKWIDISHASNISRNILYSEENVIYKSDGTRRLYVSRQDYLLKNIFPCISWNINF